MPTLYITVGISGCGKSTFANTQLKGVEEINLDNIRKELFGAYTGVNEKVVVSEYMCRLSDYLRAGKDIVLSNTNLNVARIKELFNTVPGCYNIYVYCFDISRKPEICYERIQEDIKNGKSRSNTPKDVVFKMADKYNEIYNWLSVNQFRYKNVKIFMIK